MYCSREYQLTSRLKVSILRGWGGLERTHFNSFYFGWVWWSWKNRIYWFFIKIWPVSFACCMGLRNQLCQWAQKLRLTPLGNLRKSHQQATQMPDSPHKPEEESPTMPTAAEAEANSPPEPWGEVTSRQPQHWPPLTDQWRSHLPRDPDLCDTETESPMN